MYRRAEELGAEDAAPPRSLSVLTHGAGAAPARAAGTRPRSGSLTRLVLRRITPVLVSVLLIVAVYQGTFLSRSRTVAEASARPSTWLGPRALCETTRSRRVDDASGVGVYSNVASDGSGTVYFADDALPLNASELSLGCAQYRLRKLSSSGAQTYDMPLFAQLRSVRSERRRRALALTGPPRSVAGNGSVPRLSRLGVTVAVMPFSAEVLVLQQGSVNASSAGCAASGVGPTPFAHVSLLAAVDGDCIAGAAFVDGADAPVVECASVYQSPTPTQPFLMDVALTRSWYASSAGIAASDAAAVCATPAYVLGRSGLDVSITVIQHLYGCDVPAPASSSPLGPLPDALPALSTPTITYARVLPTNSPWDTPEAAALLTLQTWPSVNCKGACEAVSVPGAGIAPDDVLQQPLAVVTAYPLRPISPWPNDTALLAVQSLVSDIVVYNASTLQESWSISNSFGGIAFPIVAIISNVIASPTGTLYFAAVRNVSGTSAAATNSSFDVALLAVDIVSANILWQSAIVSAATRPMPTCWLHRRSAVVQAPLNTVPLVPGAPVQMVQLAFSPNALLFCARPPALNGTGASDTTMLPSAFGLGAVNTVGGELVSGHFVYTPLHAPSK